jgi:hypothetical protein
VATIKNEAALGAAEALNCVHVTAGTNQLAFALPHGYRMSASADKINLVSDDISSSFMFRIIQPGAATTKPNLYREMASNRFPGALVTNESSCRAANHAGPAFDLQWRNPGGGMQSIRIAYISSPAGLLEICLITAPEKFGENLFCFRMILDSLRTNELGKLEPATLPGNS